MPPKKHKFEKHTSQPTRGKTDKRTRNDLTNPPANKQTNRETQKQWFWNSTKFKKTTKATKPWTLTGSRYTITLIYYEPNSPPNSRHTNSPQWWPVVWAGPRFRFWERSREVLTRAEKRNINERLWTNCLAQWSAGRSTVHGHGFNCYSRAHLEGFLLGKATLMLFLAPSSTPIPQIAATWK